MIRCCGVLIVAALLVSGMRAGCQSTVTLTGSAWDSSLAVPLRGAVIQIVDPAQPSRAFTAVADSSGDWRMDGVTPGQWVLGFLHPTLDLLGIEPPLRAVTLSAGDSVKYLDVSIPGAATVRSTVCPSPPVQPTRRNTLPAPIDSSGLLIGLVMEAGSRSTRSDARVIVSWSDIEVTRTGINRAVRRVPVEVQGGGRFAICGLPTDGAIIVTADVPGMRSAQLEVRIPPGGMVRRDLVVDSVAGQAAALTGITRAEPMRGSARLTGVVRDSAGRSMRGAQVSVWETEASTTTGADGSFALSGLPSGPWIVEARSLGWSPVQRTVDLSAERPASAEFVIRESAREIAPVIVRAGANKGIGPAAEFEAHKKSGLGTFINGADIENERPLYVTDVLRKLPSLTVFAASSRSGGQWVRMRGGCKPLVFLNGIPIQDGADTIDDNVQPNGLVGIEVYRLGEVPPQYSGTQLNQCGAIAIWTR